MRTLSPEQKREISRRVHETFDRPERWFQGGWGRDDSGGTLDFDGGLHVRDERGRMRPPALGIRRPGALRCFCLAATIRIHTGAILGFDPAGLSELTEEVSAIYVKIGGLEQHVSHDNTFEPCLEAVVEWNDRQGRSFADIQTLTAAVVRHLDAERWGIPS